jgi:hypothetical protein
MVKNAHSDLSWSTVFKKTSGLKELPKVKGLKVSSKDLYLVVSQLVHVLEQDLCAAVTRRNKTGDKLNLIMLTDAKGAYTLGK